MLYFDRKHHVFHSSHQAVTWLTVRSHFGLKTTPGPNLDGVSQPPSSSAALGVTSAPPSGRLERGTLRRFSAISCCQHKFAATAHGFSTITCYFLQQVIFYRMHYCTSTLYEVYSYVASKYTTYMSTFLHSLIIHHLTVTRSFGTVGVAAAALVTALPPPRVTGALNVASLFIATLASRRSKLPAGVVNSFFTGEFTGSAVALEFACGLVCTGSCNDASRR